MRADHRHQSGRATGSVLLLLVMLSGAGGWNYHRNLQLEAETEGSRPFESYSTDDLATLRDAYQSELSGVRAKFADAKSQRARRASAARPRRTRSRDGSLLKRAPTDTPRSGPA